MAGRSELTDLPESVAAALIELLDGYFAIGEQLASDTVGAMAQPSRQVAGAMDTLLEAKIPEEPHREAAATASTYPRTRSRRVALTRTRRPGRAGCRRVAP